MNEDAIRVVGARIGLRGGYRSRDWVQYHCPFAEWTHPSGSDSRASFGIHVKESIGSHYYCFTCKKAGPLPNLPAEISKYDGEDRTGMTFEIIRMEMEQGFGMFDAPRFTADDEPEALDEAGYGDLYDPAWEVPEARHYLSMRGITQEACERMGLGWEPSEKRIVFPVRDVDGVLYGFSGRTILEPEEYPTDVRDFAKVRDFAGLKKRSLLLNMQNHTRGNKILLVEGLFDVAAVMSQRPEELGITPVGVMGSALHEPQALTLVEIGDPVYLMFDNDEAGEAGIYGTYDREEWTRHQVALMSNPNARPPRRRGGAIKALVKEIPVYVPFYPEGVNEPDGLTHQDLIDILADTQMEELTKHLDPASIRR